MSAAKHLRAAPTEADILRGEITAICEQLDRRNGTTPGYAEKVVYWWHYPPCDITSVDVLTALHADAVEFLREAVTR